MPSVEWAAPVYWLITFKGLTFLKKMKMMNLQYFCIFMYIWWLLKFVGFFVESLQKIFTKRPPVATTVPSGTQRHHWGIGIPGYTFESSIQARAIPSSSGGSAPRWLQTVYRVSNFMAAILSAIFQFVIWFVSNSHRLCPVLFHAI